MPSRKINKSTVASCFKFVSLTSDFKLNTTPASFVSLNQELAEMPTRKGSKSKAVNLDQRQTRCTEWKRIEWKMPTRKGIKSKTIRCRSELIHQLTINHTHTAKLESVFMFTKDSPTKIKPPTDPNAFCVIWRTRSKESHCQIVIAVTPSFKEIRK